MMLTTADEMRPGCGTRVTYPWPETRPGYSGRRCLSRRWFPHKPTTNNDAHHEHTAPNQRHQPRSSLHATTLPCPQMVDLDRGAGQFGIRARVLVAADILADYQEVDVAIGHNTAGMVLLERLAK